MASRLAEGLQPHGCDVTCYATGSDEEKSSIKGLGSRAKLFPRVRPLSWFRSPELAAELRKDMGALDLLHLHQLWDYPLYVASRLGSVSGVPYVITPHGTLEPWCLNQKKWKKRMYMWLIAGAMLRQAACIHAVTPPEVDGFVKLGLKNPFTIVPNGIEPDEFTALPMRQEADFLWRALHGRKVVLYLGRIHYKKGLDQLIPAWSAVSRKHDDSVLVVAGPDEGGHEAAIRALVKREGTDNSVLFTGMLRGRRKLAMLARADAFVLPSYSEGFSMAVLEAMACGLPCILTPGCNFPQAQKAGAAFIVEPKAGPLGEAVSEVLNMGESQRRAMGERGRRLVLDNYTWDIAARKMITVYRCILGGKRIPLYPEPAQV